MFDCTHWWKITLLPKNQMALHLKQTQSIVGAVIIINDNVIESFGLVLFWWFIFKRNKLFFF